MSGGHVGTRAVADMLVELDMRDLTGEFEAVAKRHNCLLDEVMGPRRFGGFVAARQECWGLLRQRGWSYPRIGLLFDRDHTTVMHGVGAHEARMARIVMDDLNRGAA